MKTAITRQYARKVARKTPNVAARAWVNAEQAATYYKQQFEAMEAVLLALTGLKIDTVDMVTGEVARADMVDRLQWHPTEMDKGHETH